MRKSLLAPFVASVLCSVSANGAAPAEVKSQGPRTPLFKPAVVISEPQPLEWPQYTHLDREAFFSLRIEVSEKGRVSNATLIEDSGFYSPPFVQECIAHAKAIVFKPATLDGKPIKQFFIQPCSFTIGATGVTPQFNVETQKVTDLFKSGDYAGADFHAQWMLKETVRYAYEYAVLQSTLAITHAGLGQDHDAILFAEGASQRKSLDTRTFSLHQPIPVNSAANYLLPKQLVISLLNMRMSLAAKNGMLKKALQAYYEMAELDPIPPDDPRVAAAAELTAKLQSSEPVTARIVLVRSRWKHELYRRRFTLEHVSGNVSSITLQCGSVHQELVYTPGDDWTVPDGSQDCVLNFDGETGTSFELVELAD